MLCVYCYVTVMFIVMLQLLCLLLCYSCYVYCYVTVMFIVMLQLLCLLLCYSCYVYCYVTVAYVCIPRSFLVINVCNQGKTLCSPCIWGKNLLINKKAKGKLQPETGHESLEGSRWGWVVNTRPRPL